MSRWKFKTPLTVVNFQPPQSSLGHDDVYLEAFRYRFIDGIVGKTTRPAWKQLILQATHQESAFRHAAIAFGAAYGLVDGSETSAVSSKTALALPVASKKVALLHYNQCIQYVQRMIADGKNCSINKILLCTLLCICLEIRIKKPDNALRHLEHSLSILDSNPAAVDNDIALVFTKLDVQAAAFLGHRSPRLVAKGLPGLTPGNGDDYADADRTLTCLQNNVFTFIRTKADPFKYHRVDGTVPNTLFDEVKTLEDDLERFRRHYLPAGSLDAAAIAGLPYKHQILCITYLMMSVLLSSCLCIDEGVYDAFFSDFLTIITVAENIINVWGGGADGVREFHLDMAILHPVYKTAQMCRCPHTRRRAIALMDNVSFDEGVWDAESGKLYIGILMRLEEEGLDLEKEDLATLGPSIIPESRRIRTLDVQPETAERYWTVFYRRSPSSGQWDEPVETALW